MRILLSLFLPAVNHYMCSKFHFVDLAGSERAHRTGNAGNRLKGKRQDLVSGHATPFMGLAAFRANAAVHWRRLVKNVGEGKNQNIVGENGGNNR